MAKKANKCGKPNYYEKLNIADKLNSVRGWTLDGATMSEIAAMLGVSETTVYKWQGEYAEFAEAIKKGREVATGEIINSAHRQAVGYTVMIKQPFKVKEVLYKNGKRLSETERIEVVEFEQYHPPVAPMTMFMLKNRLPDKYRDKQEQEHTGAIEFKIPDGVKRYAE